MIPKTIYGARLVASTRLDTRPVMVGHSEPNGGEWYFWPEDYGVYVPGFSDPYPTQDEAEQAADEWSKLE